MAIDTNQMEALIARLRRFQENRGLSDKQFCKEYEAYVGSTKTWKDRLCAWAEASPEERAKIELDHERWGAAMRVLVAKIDGPSELASDFMWEMPFPTVVGKLVADLRQRTTDRRNLYVIATTGCGKSVTQRAILKERPNDTAYTRMHAGCRNNEMAIKRRIAEAIGVRSELYGEALHEQLVIKLNTNRMLVLIDEAHEMGTAGMKIVKTLIDETQSCFAQFCYPTEYDRVRTATTGALEEAKQLLGRTVKPVFEDYRDGLMQVDVETYLARTALSPEEAKDVAPVILGAVRANGNLRILADAVHDAREVCQLRDLKMTGAMIVEGVQAQCPSLKGTL